MKLGYGQRWISVSNCVEGWMNGIFCGAAECIYLKGETLINFGEGFAIQIHTEKG